MCRAYVARACAYFWETAPHLARDPRRAYDVASRGADHAAATYAILANRPPSLSKGFSKNSEGSTYSAWMRATRA